MRDAEPKIEPVREKSSVSQSATLRRAQRKRMSLIFR
jgi:hypothetical protein